MSLCSSFVRFREWIVTTTLRRAASEANVLIDLAYNIVVLVYSAVSLKSASESIYSSTFLLLDETTTKKQFNVLPKDRRGTKVGKPKSELSQTEYNKCLLVSAIFEHTPSCV